MTTIEESLAGLQVVDDAVYSWIKRGAVITMGISEMGIYATVAHDGRVDYCAAKNIIAIIEEVNKVLDK